MSYVLSKGIKKIPKIPDKNYLKDFPKSKIKPLKNPKTTT